MGEVVGDAEVGARVQGARLGREAEATRRHEAVEREVVEAAAVRHGQPAPGADAAQHGAQLRCLHFSAPLHGVHELKARQRRQANQQLGHPPLPTATTSSS